MAGITTSLYIKDKEQWIIKKAIDFCKKTKFNFQGREYKTRSDIINLGLEMVRQYFHIERPLDYKELKRIDEFLDD